MYIAHRIIGNLQVISLMGQADMWSIRCSFELNHKCGKLGPASMERAELLG